MKYFSMWLVIAVFFCGVPRADQILAADGADNPPAKKESSFTLTSPQIKDGGALPKEFTGDGASATLPLEWTGAPAGTKSFALIMHHIPGPGDVKWYWIIYNIPSDVHSLPKNVIGVGKLGNNSVNRRTEYAPPHSKGPGAKTYILTIYALSQTPKLSVPPEDVNREVLLAAMNGSILASAELKVTYDRTSVIQGAGNTEPRQGAERPAGADGPSEPPPGRRGGVHLLPRGVEEKLKLTPVQIKQLAELESETQLKVDKILTPSQQKQLEELQPPPPPQ